MKEQHVYICLNMSRISTYTNKLTHLYSNIYTIHKNLYIFANII